MTSKSSPGVSYHQTIILNVFYLGNKCFYIGEHRVDSGRTYFEARNFCRNQRGIRSDLASFDNELENGMSLYSFQQKVSIIVT